MRKFCRRGSRDVNLVESGLFQQVNSVRRSPRLCQVLHGDKSKGRIHDITHVGIGIRWKVWLCTNHQRIFGWKWLKMIGNDWKQSSFNFLQPQDQPGSETFNLGSSEGSYKLNRTPEQGFSTNSQNKTKRLMPKKIGFNREKQLRSTTRKRKQPSGICHQHSKLLQVVRAGTCLFTIGRPELPRQSIRGFAQSWRFQGPKVEGLPMPTFLTGPGDYMTE